MPALIDVETMMGCAATTQTSPGLTGHVNSQDQRDDAEKVASRVPDAKQVVIDLQVKNQKAGSSE